MNMMNSFHNTVKYLRLMNLKTALNVTKELKPKIIQNVHKDINVLSNKAKTISFSPRSLNVKIDEKPFVGKIREDPVKYIPIINPRSILPLLETNWRSNEIGLPAVKQEEKQAVRLIVIRRKKMKKHQRRKLFKRMRHRWARVLVFVVQSLFAISITQVLIPKQLWDQSNVKQRRRQVKEKIFQTGLLAMVKEANDFSAEAYVASKLEKANHNPLPTRWKHKRLPEFIIRQLMGIDKKINYKHSDVYKA